MSTRIVAPGATPVNQAMSDLRVQTLLTVASLCTAAGLPVPREITMTEHRGTGTRSVRLGLDVDDVDGVLAWAGHLGLTEIDRKSHKTTHWCAGRAAAPDGRNGRLAKDGMVWLGWHDVEVVTFLDARADR